MSTTVRCLLDKVVVRYTLDGLLNLSLGRDVTSQQFAALQLFQSSASGQVDLFIAPASANILGRLQSISRFDAIIQVLLRRTQIATPTRYFTRWSRSRAIRAFVDGVTAAATGAIAGAAFVLGRRAIVDVPTLAIAVGALCVASRFRRVPEPLLILVAGVVGVLLKKLGS